MENNRPRYGISPLVAFCEAMQRQRDIDELYRRFKRSTSVICRTKHIDPEKLKDFKPIVCDAPIEWLPMGENYEKEIYRAFGITPEMLELKMRI